MVNATGAMQVLSFPSDVEDHPKRRDNGRLSYGRIIEFVRLAGKNRLANAVPAFGSTMQTRHRAPATAMHRWRHEISWNA
jgi:hypothetical protein